MTRIDLNADLGESFGVWRLGDDAGMLQLVSSANVACGFHAGDPATLLETVTLAAGRGVAIGAQVSYPDLPGFGRRFLDMTADDLRAAVLYQLGALDGLCRSAGSAVRYLKPHGALYNSVVHHEVQATAVVEALEAYNPALPVVGLPGSALLEVAAQRSLHTISEAFADRNYTADGTLVPRSEPNAVLDDADEIARRVLRMVLDGAVAAIDGSVIPLAAESICIHGDTPGAVTAARSVRTALEQAGVVIEAFAAEPG